MRINALLDASIIEAQKKAIPRDYLGASLIGESCSRKIQYQYFNTARDEDKPWSAQTLRIFKRGHVFETIMAEWLRQAGFDLATEDYNGKQFSFSILGGKIKGHADGVIRGGPEGFAYPMLWENKALGSKSWKELQKNKLVITKPVYAVQIALYQAYLKLYENPALFTAINMNTMEIYAELVPFDSALAQQSSDKAVRIIQACESGELLPRVSQTQKWFECKMCPWAKRCWKIF